MATPTNSARILRAGAPACTDDQGKPGTCIPNTSCTGRKTSGKCSGAANIQCCSQVPTSGPTAGGSCSVQVPANPPAGGSAPLTPNTNPVDSRSEENIALLHPKVRNIMRALVNGAAAYGFTVKVISSLRTYAEQAALYAKGRTAPGPIVTKAPAGWSNHNFGLAVDLGVFVADKYQPESPTYAKIGPIGRALGLDWGGDWTGIKDMPHYQYRPLWAKGIREGEMLRQLRARKDAKKDFLDASDNVNIGNIPAPGSGAGPMKTVTGTCMDPAQCTAGTTFSGACSGATAKCCVPQ